MSVTLTTREAIARAAGRLFEQRGYTATSVRAVAAQAGVDPALVIRHFGSKEKLFLDTMDLQGHFGGATLGPLEEMFVVPLTPRLPGPDAELRARLIGAQVAGLLDQMALVEDPVLVSADPALVARTYGAAIQALVDAPSHA